MSPPRPEHTEPEPEPEPEREWGAERGELGVREDSDEPDTRNRAERRAEARHLGRTSRCRQLPLSGRQRAILGRYARGEAPRD